MVDSKPVESLSAQTVDIDSVEPHPESPRSGDIPMLMSSLATHGQFRPLTVNVRDNRILKGNNTYKAARKLGWRKIAIVTVDVDDQHARRIMLADNRAADLSSYNVPMLVDLLSVVKDLDGTGFELSDLESLAFPPVEQTTDPPSEVGRGGKQAMSSFVQVKVGQFKWGVDKDFLESWESAIMVEAKDVKAQAARLVRARLGIPPEPKKKRKPKTENGGESILTVEIVPMGALELWEPNPREGDVGMISESLLFNGQYTPIVVQEKTNRIIIGNHTFRAAQWLGWSHISVSFLDVSDEQALKIMLMDNRASDVSEYDGELLKRNLLALESFDGTGFSDEDVDDIFRGYSTKPSSKQRKGIRVSMDTIKFSVKRDVFFAWADTVPSEKPEQELSDRLGIPHEACEFPDA